MSGPGDGGNGFKKKDHNLEAEFSLDPGQEDVVCVDLEGEWNEQSKIYKHPSFDDTDIKFVSGEVGEGGDPKHYNAKYWLMEIFCSLNILDEYFLQEVMLA